MVSSAWKFGVLYYVVNSYLCLSLCWMVSKLESRSHCSEAMHSGLVRCNFCWRMCVAIIDVCKLLNTIACLVLTHTCWNLWIVICCSFSGSLSNRSCPFWCCWTYIKLQQRRDRYSPQNIGGKKKRDNNSFFFLV